MNLVIFIIALYTLKYLFYKFVHIEILSTSLFSVRAYVYFFSYYLNLRKPFDLTS